MVINALSQYLELSESERWQYLDWLYTHAPCRATKGRPIEEKVEHFLSMPVAYQKRFIRRYLST
jgi:hypothetical protein